MVVGTSPSEPAGNKETDESAVKTETDETATQRCVTAALDSQYTTNKDMLSSHTGVCR